MTYRLTTEGLRCYACGQQPDQEFVLFTLSDHTDRVFVGCRKCMPRFGDDAKQTMVCTRSFYVDALSVLRRILHLVRFTPLCDYVGGWLECPGCRETWWDAERHLPSCPIQQTKELLKGLN